MRQNNKLSLNLSTLTFADPCMRNGNCAGVVESGACEPQGAVSQLPVLPAAQLHLESRALITAAARVPRQHAPFITALCGDRWARALRARRTRLSRGCTQQHAKVQQDPHTVTAHTDTSPRALSCEKEP